MIDIQSTVLLDIIKNRDLNAFKSYIKEPSNIGVLKHHVKNFIIQQDNAEFFKLVWDLDWLMPVDRYGLENYVYETDALECYKIVYSHDKITRNFGFSCEKIYIYVFEQTKGKDRQELFNHVYRRFQFGKQLETFFFQAYTNGWYFSFNTAIHFAVSEKYLLVKWLLDSLSDHVPTQNQIECLMMCNTKMLSLFCHHSPLVWQACNRVVKLCIDPERVLRDDYNEIVNFPLFWMGEVDIGKLPVYEMRDFLQMAYPDNIHLKNIAILKLIEEIQKKYFL